MKSSAYKKLGFEPIEPVATLQSIAHLFRSGRSRCGIYLLEFSGYRFYIGQAVDAVRRFSQHRKNYDDILGFAFCPVPRPRLNTVEKELIHKAEGLGLLILNTVHAANVIGDTDLDMVVSPGEQQAWLASRKGCNLLDGAARIELPAAQIERYLPRFQRYQKQPFYAEITRLVATYVNECLPLPKRTEYSFWSISCMPGTNANSWPRLVCVNAGVMELCVLGYRKGEPGQVWGFVNVASDVLLENYGTTAAIESALPKIEVHADRKYQDAGQHQFRLSAYDLDALTRLLNDVAVQKSAATLALRVMRKRATIYSKFHCKPLADALLSIGVETTSLSVSANG